MAKMLSLSQLIPTTNLGFIGRSVIRAPCVGCPLDTTSIGSKHPCYRCAGGGGFYLGSTPLDPWLLFDLRLNLGALTGPEVANWGQLPSYLASFVGPESASKP